MLRDFRFGVRLLVRSPLFAVAAVTVMGTVGTNLSSTFNSVAGAL